MVEQTVNNKAPPGTRLFSWLDILAL